MLKTPILFLIFNRPDLTEKVLDKIRKIKPEKLFVAADGPRLNKDSEAELCKLTRDTVLNNIDWECEVHTLLRDENLGCKNAVSSAITWFFDNVESGIILEDDILPDQSFFNFCEEMLIRYKDDDRITQISGVNLMGQTNIKESYFYSKIGGIWGWATWKRVWKNYNVDIISWGDQQTKNEIKAFLGNTDWYNRIKNSFEVVYNQQYDTWDYQWVFTQMKAKGMAIIPRDNIVENIGFRHDATHTKSKNELIESKMKSHKLTFPLQHPSEVVSNNQYTSYYFSLLNIPNSNFTRLIAKIKNKIKNGLKKSN